MVSLKLVEAEGGLCFTTIMFDTCAQSNGEIVARLSGQVVLPLGQRRLPAHSWLGEHEQMHCIIHNIATGQ